MVSRFLCIAGATVVAWMSGLGQVQGGMITINASNSGWYKSDGSKNGTTGNLLSGVYEGGSYRNWLGFNLVTVTEPITSAKLLVASNSQNQSGQLFDWYDVTTSYYMLGTVPSTAIYSDLGSGVLFASGTHTAGALNEFTLNANGVASLNSASSYWAIGGVNTQPNSAFGFTFGLESNGIVQLVLETQSVPEPATMSLMGLGLLGLAFTRRRFVRKPVA